MLAASAIPASTQSSGARPGSVLRGNLTGNIWVEIAHDGQNFAELAVLDGLPGGPPQTQFYPLAVNRSAGGCSLASADGNTTVSACPFNGSVSANISLGAMSGTAILQDVGWNGSFAWGNPNAPTADIRSRCALPTLSKAGYLSGTALAPAISTLAQSAQALPSRQGDPAADLARLRSDRLKAYALIALNADEAARAKWVEDAIAGRPVLGKTVPLTEATREKMAFDRDVVNLPVRVQAREDLIQVDRALSGIYDVQSSSRSVALQEKLKVTDYPYAERTLKDILALRQPGSIPDLVALESAAGELDNCGAALGLKSGNASREAVRTAMVQRASDIAAAIRIAVNASAGSAAARSTLQAYENNAAIRQALETAGQSGVFDDARNKILQLAAAEEKGRNEAERQAAKARIEAEKQAALEAERDKIPPTTSGANFDYERVSRSVMYVGIRNGSGSGFVVAPGYVVTNAHVVGNETDVFVVPNNEAQGYSATVVSKSDRHDLALLSVPGLKAKILALSSVDPSTASKVYALGFPGVADNLFSSSQRKYDDVIATVTDGIVSRVVDADAGLVSGLGMSHLVQHTADIAPGNSGGALMDACHRVIGVNTLFTKDSKRNTTHEVGFAISSIELIRFLKNAGVTPQVSNSTCK